MVPLYVARIEDLGPGDFVRVECGACGRDVLIPASVCYKGYAARHTLLSSIWNPGSGAGSAMRAGKAVVSIRWAQP
jgi:hypothetical protein